MDEAGDLDGRICLRILRQCWFVSVSWIASLQIAQTGS
jgi:hypothetical protein